MRSLLFASVVSACMAPTVAAAELPRSELSMPVASEAAARREWYGYQILFTDFATVVSTGLLLGIDDHRTLAPYNFIGGYLGGGPIVHLTHDNPGRAMGSLAMRAALPVLGAWAGCSADNDHNGEDGGCIGGTAIGALIGFFGAAIVDVTALSYAEARPRAKTFEVTPTASVTQQLATVGLQGAF